MVPASPPPPAPAAVALAFVQSKPLYLPRLFVPRPLTL